MSENTQKDGWVIGPYNLKLILDSAGVGRLNYQTPNRKLLTTLALAGFKDVANCALDLIFNNGPVLDEKDAYAAYAYCPLKNPPAEYLTMFKSVNWTSESPPLCRYAIILAGSQSEDNRLLLLNILKTLDTDYREAAIYAASSFPEERFIQALAQLALTTGEHDGFETGEMMAFIFCFRRWLEAKVLDSEKLERLFRSIESSQACRMSWKRLANYIMCRDWYRLPFPEERTKVAPR